MLHNNFGDELRRRIGMDGPKFDSHEVQRLIRSELSACTEDLQQQVRLEVDAERVPEGLAARVDAALCGAYHYRLARQLGQLGPVEAVPRAGRTREVLDAAPVWGADKGSVLRR